ncbi:MAG: hypothetical protein PHV82_16995, partial [Victivallaceae bacterium]|nr:hypothetical protein [Victivallaceae bacterium]
LSGPSNLNLTFKSPPKYEEKLPALAWFDAAFQGKRYLIAVNSANQLLKVAFSGLPRINIKVKDAISGIPITNTEKGNFTVGFKPLEVKCMVMERE